LTQRAPESLSEARRLFSSFLQQNGYPTQIRWVTREDVVWTGGELLVRLMPRSSAWDDACRVYAVGIGRKLGVCLHAFASLDGSTIATVIMPKDDDAAQRALIAGGGLKMSADVRMVPSRAVGSTLAWSVCSLRYRSFSRQFWQSCCEYS
jgi:hypothetical protein